MSKSFEWTPERVQQLKDLVAKGEHSFAQIAALMGCTSRNQPLCKWNRLRAADPTLSHPHVRMGGPVRRPKLVISPVPPPTPRSREPETQIEPEKDEEGGLLTEENIKGHQCRFPFGDPGAKGFHYCGHQKKDGSSYCEEHHKRVYRSYAEIRKLKKQKQAA